MFRSCSLRKCAHSATTTQSPTGRASARAFHQSRINRSVGCCTPMNTRSVHTAAQLGSSAVTLSFFNGAKSSLKMSYVGARARARCERRHSQSHKSDVSKTPLQTVRGGNVALVLRTQKSIRNNVEMEILHEMSTARWLAGGQCSTRCGSLAARGQQSAKSRSAYLCPRLPYATRSMHVDTCITRVLCITNIYEVLKCPTFA